MKVLDREASRLIVEAGVAATNHHLLQEAEPILAALPWLVTDLSIRKLVSAILLAGLHRFSEALASLEGEHSEEAIALRNTIQEAITAQQPASNAATTALLVQPLP